MTSIPFQQTVFQTSAATLNQAPADDGLEVAFCGRSNAGKSSALNALTENTKLARISKTPGRTTEINFFKVNDGLKLVDLPGYGFAKSAKSQKKDWGPLLRDYFKKRKALKAVIIFMDIRHPLKDSDIEMIKLCSKSNVDFIPVLTKSDKLSNNKIVNSIKDVNKRLIGCEAIAISAKDQKGIELLSKEIMRYCSA